MDAERYSGRLNRLRDRHTKDDEQLKMYGSTTERMEQTWKHPCFVKDKHGKILLWYLPEILTPDRQVFVRPSVRLVRLSDLRLGHDASVPEDGASSVPAECASIR